MEEETPQLPMHHHSIKELIFQQAPGTNIYAVGSGTVTMAKFNGSGGCTVCISDGHLSYTYCHVSPTFIVCPGQKVKKGDLIAYVGPKNVYGFSENKYYDSSR